MAMKTNKGKAALFTEINITPLTDIFLVLLIIMMVIAPSFQSVDNSINVPEINSGISVENKNAVIAITKEGSFFINGKQINPELLVNELEIIKPTLEKKEVVVKADKDTKSKQIMSVMNAAQNAGFEKLIVAGEPLTKKAQEELRKTTEQQSAPVSNADDNMLPRVSIPIEG